MFQGFGRAILGRTVELRYTPDGTPVANLSLAFSYGRKGEDGKKPTTWVDASLWGKQAEALAPYLVKGQSLAVVVEDLHVETFKRQDGTLGSKIAGRVLSIEFAAPAPRQEGDAPAPPAKPTVQKPAAKPAAAPTGFDDMDDDIPF